MKTYYSKLWNFWSTRCVSGEISEDEFNFIMDTYKVEDESDLKEKCKRLNIRVEGEKDET